MASYKEKYLVKYLVAGSALNSLTYASISSYGLWCNVSCLLRLVPGPCRLQCLALVAMPLDMWRSSCRAIICGAFFFLKLTYLGPILTYLDPHVRVRRWTGSYFRSSWSLDILNSWFKCKCWIFWTHELIFYQCDINEILIKDHIHFFGMHYLNITSRTICISSVIRY